MGVRNDGETDEVCITHIYPHEPLKIEMAICDHQFDCPFCMQPDVWSGDLQTKESSVVVHDTICLYWDQMS